MAMVDLRGPCNHLTARLDTERRLIERKCPQCTQIAGEPVYHYFDAVTGEFVAALLEHRDEFVAADVPVPGQNSKVLGVHALAPE